MENSAVIGDTFLDWSSFVKRQASSADSSNATTGSHSQAAVTGGSKSDDNIPHRTVTARGETAGVSYYYSPFIEVKREESAELPDYSGHCSPPRQYAGCAEASDAEQLLRAIRYVIEESDAESEDDISGTRVITDECFKSGSGTVRRRRRTRLRQSTPVRSVYGAEYDSSTSSGSARGRPVQRGAATAVVAAAAMEVESTRPHTCHHCSYRARLKHHLKLHIMQKHSTPPHHKAYACNLCTYKAHRVDALSAHIMFKHSTTRAHKCGQCAFNAKTMQHLKQHMINKHTHHKPFICEHCSYRAKTHSALNRHVTCKHSADSRRHVCGDCRFTTKTRDHLKRHILNKHREHKAFVCVQCSYKTKTRSSLKRHSLKMH